MKKFITLVALMLVSTYSFADTPSNDLRSHAPEFKSLGSAWKTHASAQPSLNQNDMIVGYGGQDVTKRTTLVSYTIAS